MILLDPELVPDPADSGTAAGRIPSARTLSRFLVTAQTAVRVRGDVSVLLTTDLAIRRLNRQFRGKNKPTDVLSFPAEPIPGLRAAEQTTGDLAISVETARRQGAACGHSLGTELKVLILHGLLHLAGYDHEADSGRMDRRERALRERLGLPSGLIERAAERPEKTAADSSTWAGKAAFAQNDKPTRRTSAGCPILAPAGRKGGKPPSLMRRASRVPQP
jgi:probable rRNA maturation factor